MDALHSKRCSLRAVLQWSKKAVHFGL